MRAVEGVCGRSWAVAVVAAVATTLPGCGAVGDQAGPEADIVVVEAYAAEPVTRESGAAYFTIENRTDAPDTLLGASTPVAAMAHLHRMAGSGASQMRTQDVAAVPAGARLRLQPGGLHLMLTGITSMPRAGDTIDVTLRFRTAGSVPVRVPVLSYLEVSERATVGRRGGQR